MAVFVLIVCAVLWLVIQAHLADQGVHPRSRGSLRYQHRKARELGLNPEDVDLRSRGQISLPSEPGNQEHDNNVVSGLLRSLLMIVLIVVGGLVIMRSGYDGGWSFVWIAFLAAAFWLYDKWA